MADDIPALPPSGDDDLPEACQGLTIRQLNFCKYMALYDQPTKAARLAKYAESSMNSTPFTLVENRAIQDGIAHFRTVYASRLPLSPEKIVQQWAEMASFDTTTILRDDWSIKQLNELDGGTRDALRQALVGVEVTEKADSRTIKPKFAKMQALEALAKFLKMWEVERQGGEGGGLHLTINLGQQTTVSGQEPSTSVGHVQMRLGTSTSEKP